MPSSSSLSSASCLSRSRARLQRQLGPHARNEFGLVERLGDVVHAARFQRADNEILVIRRGKKNDRDVLPVRIFLQLPADFAAVHARHEQIEQDQIGRPQGQAFQGRRAVAGGNDFVAQGAQHRADDLDVGGLVVHDQNSGRWRIVEREAGQQWRRVRNGLSGFRGRDGLEYPMS